MTFCLHHKDANCKTWSSATMTPSLPLPSTWQEVKLPLQLPCSTIWWCRRPPRLVWHPRFHYPAGKRAPLDPILNHIKLARTIPFKAHLCMGLPTDSFPLGVSYKKKLYMHLSPKWLPPPPNNNILLWYEFRSTSLCNCLHPSLSISKYSQHPVLQHLQFTFFHLDYRWTWPTFNNCTLPSARTALTALWSLLICFIPGYCNSFTTYTRRTSAGTCIPYHDQTTPSFPLHKVR